MFRFISTFSKNNLISHYKIKFLKYILVSRASFKISEIVFEYYNFIF